MAEPSETSRPREAPAAEAARCIAPRGRTADQRLRIQERLSMGLTIAHIARGEQLTVRPVRQIIAEMLASREIDPPAGFVQIQIARLSEAMIVARTMMLQGNLQAMDRLIKLMSELDRYRGSSPVQIPWAREAAPPRLAAPEPRAIPPSRGVSSPGSLRERAWRQKRESPGNGAATAFKDHPKHSAPMTAELRLPVCPHTSEAYGSSCSDPTIAILHIVGLLIIFN
jgi:hypothetical protein